MSNEISTGKYTIERTASVVDLVEFMRPFAPVVHHVPVLVRLPQCHPNRDGLQRLASVDSDAKDYDGLSDPDSQDEQDPTC